LHDTLNEITAANAENMNDVPTAADESPINNTNPPSTITIAEMDIDDMPIQFRVCFLLV
jgi:hypothetical protein